MLEYHPINFTSAMIIYFSDRNVGIVMEVYDVAVWFGDWVFFVFLQGLGFLVGWDLNGTDLTAGYWVRGLKAVV